jgi:MFS family permease
VLLGATVMLSASNSAVFALIGNLQDEHGFGDLGLGLIAAAGFASAFVLQLTAAPIADRGHTKRLLVVGTLLAVVGNVLMATGSTLGQFVVARLLAGAALGCFLAPARALVADLSDTGKGERLGRLAGAELGGFVLGPVVAGLLVEPFGLRWPFALFGAAAVVALVLVSSLRVPERPVVATAGARLPLDLVRIPQVRVALLLALSLALPIGMYDALWDRFLTDLGASDVVVGLSLALYGIPFVLLASYGGRLADRYGPVTVALRALWVVAPLTALYGSTTRPWMPVAIGVVEACAQAAAAPSAQAAIARAAPPGRAAAAQGLAGAINVAVATVVALVASAAYGALGPEWVFFGAGAGVALVGARAWRLNRRHALALAASPAVS